MLSTSQRMIYTVTLGACSVRLLTLDVVAAVVVAAVVVVVVVLVLVVVVVEVDASMVVVVNCAERVHFEV